MTLRPLRAVYNVGDLRRRARRRLPRAGAFAPRARAAAYAARL